MLSDQYYLINNYFDKGIKYAKDGYNVLNVNVKGIDVSIIHTMNNYVAMGFFQIEAMDLTYVEKTNITTYKNSKGDTVSTSKSYAGYYYEGVIKLSTPFNYKEFLKHRKTFDSYYASGENIEELNKQLEVKRRLQKGHILSKTAKVFWGLFIAFLVLMVACLVLFAVDPKTAELVDLFKQLMENAAQGGETTMELGKEFTPCALKIGGAMSCFMLSILFLIIAAIKTSKDKKEVNKLKEVLNNKTIGDIENEILEQEKIRQQSYEMLPDCWKEEYFQKFFVENGGFWNSPGNRFCLKITPTGEQKSIKFVKIK